MKYKEYIFPVLNVVVMIIAITTIYNHISTIDQHVNERIEATIHRLMPNPDTSRRIVAPQLHNISNNYFYLDAKTIKDSNVMMSEYNFDPDFPTEIWEGYMTLVENTFGSKYYVWSTNKMKKGLHISVWVLADPTKFELGKHTEKKDKVYVQMVFPIVPIKKPSNITF